MDEVILHYPVWPICLANPEIWPGSEPPATKKKKKEREKMLWPSGPLTLTKKSKFSKQTCPTQIFEYILILGPVCSFEAQKLCKRPISKSWLLHKCWPNVEIFKMDLSCSIFRVHSNFGVCSVIYDLEIAQMTQFQGSWLLWWGRPKVKIFKLDLSCSVFLDLETTNLTYFSEVLAVSKT